MSGFHIVAKRAREVVLDRVSGSRGEADEILGAAMAAHPDCEITMWFDDNLILSVGPSQARGRRP